MKMMNNQRKLTANRVWRKKLLKQQSQLQLQLQMLQKQAKKCWLQKEKVGLLDLYFAWYKMSSICFCTPTLARHILFWGFAAVIGLLQHLTLNFADRKYFVEVVSLLDKQIQEMKLMTNAIRRLEGNWAISFNLFIGGFMSEILVHLCWRFIPVT